MSDNILMCNYSDDGGRTWSAEQHYDLGADGDYLRRVVFHAQGSSYNRIYRLRYTANSGITIISGHADVEFADG